MTGQRLFDHVGHTDKERLLDDLGVHVLDPIQPVGLDMAPEALQGAFGGRLAFHGGIDMQRLLPRGKPAEVAAEAQRYCEVRTGRAGHRNRPRRRPPDRCGAPDNPTQRTFRAVLFVNCMDLTPLAFVLQMKRPCSSPCPHASESVTQLGWERGGGCD
jgi:hypothetical protein